MKKTDDEKKILLESRREEKRKAKEQERIEREKNQKPVKRITITIEWKKSRMWGSNPHAEASVEFLDGTFLRKNGYTASGCGYDKESTVISDVFNDFLRYRLWSGDLPTNYQEWLNGEKVNKPYGITMRPDYVDFGGGIGTSCYDKISNFIGGKWEHLASGNSFDVYTFIMDE